MNTAHKKGSALLLTILVVSLLLVIVLSFVLVVRLELRQAVNRQEGAVARAHARLGAALALANLQEAAGPDTRVTYPLESDASLGLDPSWKMSHWTAVRDAAPLLSNAGTWSPNPAQGTTLSYLVSGDPATWLPGGKPADQPAVSLVGSASALQSSDEVLAPLVEVKHPDTTTIGRLAWWVGDEGVKARVNLADPFLLDGDSSTDARRSLTVQRSGAERILDAFDPAQVVDQQELGNILNTSHLDLLNSSPTGNEIHRRHLHDLTPYSRSLLTNTSRGGWMKDLTAVLEEAALQGGNDPGTYQLPPDEILPPDSNANQIGKLFHHSDQNLDRLLALGRIKEYVASDADSYGGNDVPDKPDYRDRIFPPMGTATSGNSKEVDQFNRPPPSSGGKDPVWGHLGQDGGGPFWRQLLSWATAKQRFSKLSDDVDFFYTTDRAMGVHPVVLRYTLMRFYTYDNSAYTLRLHFSPVVTLWNPSNVTLPSQEYYIHLFQSSENKGTGFGSDGTRETLHFLLKPKDTTQPDEWRTWNVRLITGKEGSPKDEVPAVFVGKWQGSLGPGERLTLAMASGSKKKMLDHTGNNAAGAFTKQGHRILKVPANTTDLSNMTLPLVKWNESSFGASTLGSAYVELDLNNTVDTSTGTDAPGPYTMNYELGTVYELAEIRVTFANYALAGATAIQVSPRWRYDDSGRKDLSYGEGDGASVISRVYTEAPLFTVAQPSLWIPQSIRNRSRNAAPPEPLPGHGAGIRANDVRFAQTIGLRMPDPDDPYYAGADPLQQNLYAPYAQLAFGNPIASMVGRAPPDRGPHNSANRRGYSSPPQYIGGWTTSVTDFVESTPRFGFTADSIGQRAILREFPDSIHDITSIGGLQHAMPFTQESYQFNWYGSRPGLNQLMRIGNMTAHGWGGNNVPLNAIGNSLASPFVPPEDYQFTEWEDPGLTSSDNKDADDYNYHTFYDFSYLMNEALWDDYFFSTHTNGRLHWSDPDWNEDESKIQRDVDESASLVTLEGGFNINSTSIPAWAVVLSGMLGSPVSVDGTLESDPDEAPFARFDQPGESVLSLSGVSSSEDDSIYTHTYRALSPEEIWDTNGTPDDLSDDTGLAAEIARQVEERGPFLSLADFVNRKRIDAASDPGGHRLKGALQAAIDQANLNEDVIDGAIIDKTAFQSGAGRDDWNGLQEDHVDDIPLNWGAPGFLTQADVLSRIGATLRPRSDTFTIRAYGETSGTSPATAVCEVVVQRLHAYLEPSSDAETVNPEELTSPVNQAFGRRFEIVSLRWLSEEEM